LLRLLDINKPSRQLVATAILNFREYGYFGGNFKLMVTNLNIYYLNKAVILNLHMAARAVILNLPGYYYKYIYWFDVNKAPFRISNLTLNFV